MLKRVIFVFFLGCVVIITPARAGDVPKKPFSEASYTFEVEDIAHDGNTVSFVIPENARQVDQEADAVLLSGLHLNTIEPATGEECPVVSSYNVRKDVKDYNPFNGRAKIVATFDDPNMAKAAFDQKCLLVDDPD